MFIVSGKKGTGKTRTLLEKAKAEDCIIVCEDVATMRERAYGYGITGLDIISYEEFYYNKIDKPVYIHDIHRFIKERTPCVKGYSICNE